MDSTNYNGYSTVHMGHYCRECLLLYFPLYFQQWIIIESYCLQESRNEFLTGTNAVQQQPETDQDLRVLLWHHLWNIISIEALVRCTFVIVFKVVHQNDAYISLISIWIIEDQTCLAIHCTREWYALFFTTCISWLYNNLRIQLFCISVHVCD